MAVIQQVVIFKKHILPIGDKDGVNLEFESPERFNPDTLEIFLSGLFLDKNTDFEILPGDQKFRILLEPNEPTRLNCPPLQGEPFTMNYTLS